MTEDFKTNINRFQKVPCIIDDGFKLAESIAILRLVALRGDVIKKKTYFTNPYQDLGKFIT